MAVPEPMRVSPGDVVPNPDAAFVQAVTRLPRVARWVLPATALLRRGSSSSSVNRRTRALVTLRMAALDGSEYWLAQQRAIAADVGLSSAEVDALDGGDWHDVASFDESDRAVLAWVDGVNINEAKRDKAAYAALEAHFDGGQIVELTALAGMCALLDRFANALELAPDPSAPVDVAAGVDSEEFERWAATMFEET